MLLSSGKVLVIAIGMHETTLKMCASQINDLIFDLFQQFNGQVIRAAHH